MPIINYDGVCVLDVLSRLSSWLVPSIPRTCSPSTDRDKVDNKDESLNERMTRMQCAFNLALNN